MSERLKKKKEYEGWKIGWRGWLFFFFLGLADKDHRKDPHMLVIRELKNPPGFDCN